MRSRAFALTGAACVAAALAVSGCSTSSSGSSNSSSSSVTAVGHTLRIYVSEPPGFHSDPVAEDILNAERLAFAQHSGDVTAYKLSLQQVGGAEISDNARSAIQDPSAIAYLGEIQPGTSDQTAGITNAQDLLQLSPTDTALELSDNTPAVSDSPKTYFESWSTYGRTFARVVPTSAQEAVFLVKEMSTMKLSSLYVADDGSDYGRALADEVKLYAQHSGLTIASSESSAAGIFYAATDPNLALRFFKSAESAAPHAKLFGPSSLNSGPFLSGLPSSLHVYVSVPGFAPGQLNALGKQFRSAFDQKYGHEPNIEAVFGYEAMSALIAVLKEAGSAANNRGTVVKDFLALKNRPSALGTYSINSAGNTSVDSFILARVSGGQLVPVRTASQG